MHPMIAGYRLLDEAQGTQRENVALIEPDTDATGGRRRLCCTACGAPVTERDQAMRMAGEHIHQCSNPAGFSFVVGCFRSAPGCTAVGEASAYWSWFAGFRWQVALCRSCRAQIGWRFSGETPFYALILERVRDCIARPDG